MKAGENGARSCGLSQDAKKGGRRLPLMKETAAAAAGV
jgi:hypothetical protein